MTAAPDGLRAPDDDGEWVMLCEGFHDRSFLAGLLADLHGLGALTNDQRFDRGHHGYRNRAGALVRVVPCERERSGHQGVWAQAQFRLKRRATDPLRGLVLVLDEDLATKDKADSAAEAGRRARQRLLRLAEQFGGAAPNAGGAANQVNLVDGTRLFAISWACDDPLSSPIPPAQCLERLVVAALNAAYPARGAQVDAWLRVRESPPADPAAVNKAYSWSHMAGWYADRGCDGFLKTLWSEPAVAAALTERLKQSGSWDVIEKIVTAP